MLTHYTADYMEHYLAGPLALQGYGVLGWNTRFTGAEDRFILDDAIDDIAAGVHWLQRTNKPRKIIFIGNSGGGSLMAAYTAKAATDNSLSSPDAFVFLNAHPGRADVLTNWLDPSVTDENDPLSRDPSLDMYSEENKPPYSKDFIDRYRSAQKTRNHRITAWVKKERVRFEQSGATDRVFSLHRTLADLRFMDTSIDSSDRPAPACYAGDPKRGNYNVSLLGRSCTLRTWLEMWSLQDSKAGFEHSAGAFRIPAIVIQSTCDVGVYPSDAQYLYDLLASKDKELHFVKGGHFFEEGGDNLIAVLRLMCDWVKKRLV